MTEIKFLGTGAADFSPLLATEYKDRLDENIRRSSSILINGRYLVDCGPHTIGAMKLLGTDMSKITDLFITHFHSDHYNAESVRALSEARGGRLRVWYRDGASADFPDGVHKMKMETGKTYKYGDMTVTGLAANHSGYPQHFLFCIGGKKIFYGCDGAWLLNEAFNRLKNERLDLMILDGTVGDYNGDYRISEHNSIPMIRIMLPSLRTVGAIDENTSVYISHIARTLHTDHSTLCGILCADGIKAAYDGLEISL